jgi:hypothetical protein
MIRFWHRLPQDGTSDLDNFGYFPITGWKRPCPTITLKNDAPEKRAPRNRFPGSGRALFVPATSRRPQRRDPAPHRRRPQSLAPPHRLGGRIPGNQHRQTGSDSRRNPTRLLADLRRRRGLGVSRCNPLLRRRGDREFAVDLAGRGKLWVLWESGGSTLGFADSQ